MERWRGGEVERWRGGGGKRGGRGEEEGRKRGGRGEEEGRKRGGRGEEEGRKRGGEEKYFKMMLAFLVYSRRGPPLSRFHSTKHSTVEKVR